MPTHFETTDAAGSASTSYTLANGQFLQGQVTSNGDQDWYAVSLVAGQSYIFSLVGTGSQTELQAVSCHVLVRLWIDPALGPDAARLVTVGTGVNELDTSRAIFCRRHSEEATGKASLPAPLFNSQSEFSVHVAPGVTE